MFFRKKNVLFKLTLIITVLFAGIATNPWVHQYQDSFYFYKSPLNQGRGVVLYDRLRADDGYTMIDAYRSFGGFIDMQGKIVLEIPGSHCTLLKNGGFINVGYKGYSKFSNSYKMVWTTSFGAHHDIYEDPDNGDIFALDADYDFPYNGKKIYSEFIQGHDKDGHLIFKWRVIDYLNELAPSYGGKPPSVFYDIYKKKNVITHFNSIQVLGPNKHEKNIPAFRRGNLLISCAICSCMMIIDRTTKKIVWRYQSHKLARMIHSTRLLPSGNILFFQNNSHDDLEKKNIFLSEVTEIDPTTKKTVWSYGKDNGAHFYANHLGASFQTPSGNILITHLRNGGNAFEITRDGRVVWEWNNSKKTPIFPGEIYRAIRVPKSLVDPLIASRSKYDFFFKAEPRTPGGL